MRLSEFWRAVTDEFGVVYGRAITRDLALVECSNRSAIEALAAGEDAKDVWIALCRATDVPRSRWYGVGTLPGSSRD